MSQKTNPLSLRLQKGNQNFFSPWFTDFFFSETFQHELEIRKYTDALLEETQHPKAFFSAKRSYRKLNVLLGIQDSRFQKREKQLSLNLKSSLSQNISLTKSKKVASFIASSSEKNHFVEPSLSRKSHEIDNSKSLTALKAFNPKSIQKKDQPFVSKSRLTLFPNSFETSSIDLIFRKRVRDTLLKLNQNYNLKSLLPLSDTCSRTSFGIGEKNDSKGVNTLKAFNSYTSYFNTNKIKDRYTFAFCEDIVSGYSNLSFKEKKIFHLISQNQNENTFKTEFKDSAYAMNLLSTKIDSKALQNNVFRYSGKLKGVTTYFELVRFIKDSQNVAPLLDQIVVLFEKRVSFREIISKVFQDLSKDRSIKGVRVTCSGRLGGRSKKAQKAQTQSYQWGETSLNTFSSKVLFANKSAITSYGKIGVKIWLSFKANTR